LRPAEAEAILQARLDAFLAPHAALEPVARLRQADVLFPLGQAWMRQHLGGKDEVRPRDALNAAREGWRSQQELLARQGGSEWLPHWPLQTPTHERPGARLEDLIDRAVEEAMREHREESLRVPGSLPPDGDQLAGLLFAVLEQCRDAGHLFGVQEVERLPAP